MSLRATKKANEQPHVPMRMCAACRSRRPRYELLRMVREGHQIVPDVSRRHLGRGLNLCPRPECVSLAVKRRVFSRSLGEHDGLSTDQLFARVATGFSEARIRFERDNRRARVEHATPADMSLTASALSFESRWTWLTNGFSRFTSAGTGAMNRPSANRVPSPCAAAGQAEVCVGHGES